MMMLMNAVNYRVQPREEALGVEGPVGLGARAHEDGHRASASVVDRVVAAAAVEPPCALLGTPFELVKLQMQMEARHAVGRNKNTLGQSSASTKARVIRVSVRDDASSTSAGAFSTWAAPRTSRAVSVQRRVFSAFEHTRFRFADACEARGIRREAAIATAGGSRAPPPGSCPSRWTA